MTLRFISLVGENFKRLHAARVFPTGPVTKIVGQNGAGKSSVLDAIEAVLGGAGAARRCRSATARRKPKCSSTWVTFQVRRVWNAKGTHLDVLLVMKRLDAPQPILDKLWGHLSFDPLKFARMKPAEQRKLLATVAGVDLASSREAHGKRYSTSGRTLTGRWRRARAG